MHQGVVCARSTIPTLTLNTGVAKMADKSAFDARHERCLGQMRVHSKEVIVMFLLISGLS